MLPTKPRSVFFEPEEWAAFIEAAGADDELRRTVPAFRLLLLTGSRIGEVAGLRWADVDLERKLLRVAQEKSAHRKRSRSRALSRRSSALSCAACRPRRSSGRR